MTCFAAFPDGMEMPEPAFRALAQFAPHGDLDVFASDQHNSYLKLSQSFLDHVGEKRTAGDADVTEVCRRFARALAGNASAALFNALAFESPGFRDILGESVMLIGRLEDTNTVPVDDGRGQLAQLACRPENTADKVDGFKTLVKLNPDHPDSWKRNRDWLADVFQRSQKLGKPLFNETLIFQLPGESKADMARRLPDAVVRMAEDFSPLGIFYKTQVPMLWVADGGNVERISSPQVVRDATVAMARVVKRPMLLLSAAVDFEQYCAQYGIVSDLVAGPMCGRAYFKEAFTDPATKDWDTLEQSFASIALPRIRLIRSLTRAMSRPWWHAFSEMSDDARALIKTDGETAAGVDADFGY